MSNKKKIVIMSSLVLLLAVTAVFNFIFAGSVKTGALQDGVTTANYFTTYRSERTTTRNEEIVQLDSVIALYDEGEEKYEAARDAAMQIAAINPLYLSQETVPQEDLEKEKGILMAQIKEDPKNASKPDAIIEKMMGGKINKFYEQNCLLQQEFVKDNDQKVGKYLESKGVKLINFVRFEKGEGLEKKEENFADEVASMIK
jgi:elongation factor Ts